MTVMRDGDGFSWKAKRCHYCGRWFWLERFYKVQYGTLLVSGWYTQCKRCKEGKKLSHHGPKAVIK